MNCLTHLLISKTLYHHLEETIELDGRAFMYGNIKPDLSPAIIKKPHTMENYTLVVCNMAKNLMNEKHTLKEFSINLGVICHYICDFFCYYHLNEKLFHHWKKHFLYEFDLYFEMLKLPEKLQLSEPRKARKNIHSILLDMRNDYLSKPFTKMKDLEYSINAAIWVCVSVSSYAIDSSIPVAENKAFPSPKLHSVGGQS